jgi:Na+/H+-dicarboxylate symporter
LDALLGMGVYARTASLGLMPLFAVYLGIVFAVAKQNPLKFDKSVPDVLLLTLSTSSSAAVMPLSIQTAEENSNSDRLCFSLSFHPAQRLTMHRNVMYPGGAPFLPHKCFVLTLVWAVWL